MKGRKTWSQHSWAAILALPLTRYGSLASDFIFFSFGIQKLQLVMSMTLPVPTFDDFISRIILKSKLKKPFMWAVRFCLQIFIIYFKKIILQKRNYSYTLSVQNFWVIKSLQDWKIVFWIKISKISKSTFGNVLWNS